MTAPAMPSPSRVISSSLAHLHRKGYSRPEARTIILAVIESVGKADAHWAPWQLEWLRGLYAAAARNGAGDGANAGAGPPPGTISERNQS